MGFRVNRGSPKRFGAINGRFFRNRVDFWCDRGCGGAQVFSFLGVAVDLTDFWRNEEKQEKVDEG
jgi:hypothetical protein